MAFLIFLVIVLLIAVPSIVKKKKKDKEEKAARESMYEDTGSVSDSASKPDPVKSEGKKAPATPMADNHKIHMVLRYRPESNRWVCRNCESENAVALDRCSVCHQARS